MAEPISEQIAEKVLERLQTITTVNGYRYTLDVYRADMHRGLSPRDNRAIIFEGDDEAEEPPQGHFQYRKRFAVLVFTLEPDDSMSPLDSRVNIVRADIEKAVMADPFWDDLASNTFLGGARRFDPTEETYGCVVDFDIQYQVLDSDPYSQ